MPARPYDVGHSDFSDGVLEDECPFAAASEDALDWRDGWIDARDEPK